MRRKHLIVFFLVGSAAPLLAAAGAHGAAEEDTMPRSEALMTLRGTVTEIGEAVGEGELPSVTIELETAEGNREILLGPELVLEETGFGVEVGDQLLARVFVEPETRLAYAQKVMNRSQRLVVRLRSLRREPLWDTAGRWQGTRGDTRVRTTETERPATRTRRSPSRGRGGG